MDKTFLGDNIYIEKDDLCPSSVILTVEPHGQPVPPYTIYMRFEVLRMFVKYIAEVKKDE